MLTQHSNHLTWCGTLVLMGAFTGALTYLGFGGFDTAGARVTTEPHLTPRVADAGVVQMSIPQTVVAPAPQIPVPQSAAPETVAPQAANEPVAVVEAEKRIVLASAGPPRMTEIEPPSSVLPTPPDPDPPAKTLPPERVLNLPDECLGGDICVDEYLWSFYQRTPKQDTNKVYERRKVTHYRKGKKVTVTRRFVTLVDGDFTWKDPHAAQKAGMSLKAFVIGGMDRRFKRNLLYMLLAAEQAGFAPGITSGFRDDYRQAIAVGQKASSSMSYHGGSARGGYGHGLAADIVSVTGDTRTTRWFYSGQLWDWVDQNGKTFGIGRPYLDRDAPHVAPIDGREYVSRQRARELQLAAAERKKRLAASGKAPKAVSAKATKTASAPRSGTPKIIAPGETKN